MEPEGKFPRGCDHVLRGRNQSAIRRFGLTMLSKVLFSIGGLALVAAGIAAAVVAGRFGEAETAPPVAPPLVEIVRPEPVAEPPSIVETGFVRAAERVEVAPEIAGRIVEIGEGFALGARMAEGDLLLRLSSTAVETDVTRAEARLARAEAAEEQASAALARQEELAESDFTPEAELERVAADAAAARAEVAQAEAALEAARARLDDTRLTAPFDALVIAESASPGQLLQVGQTVGTLVSADVAEVRTGLAERDFRRLRETGPLGGREVAVMVEGETIPARIAAFAPALEGQARTVDVVVEVRDPFSEARGLILNGVVTVSIPLPDAEGRLFRLPAGALHAGERLWRVTEQDRLEVVRATVARRGEGSVFVTSDTLSPDDRILMTQVPNPLPGLEVRLRGDSDTAQAEDGP